MIVTNFLGRFVSRRDKFGPFLVRIYGIGSKNSWRLCRLAGLRYNQLIGPAPRGKILLLEQVVQRTFPKEFALKRQVNANLFFKYSSGSLVGQRLAQGLPSRRQRTKTNAQTARRLKIDMAKIS